MDSNVRATRKKKPVNYKLLNSVGVVEASESFDRGVQGVEPVFPVTMAEAKQTASGEHSDVSDIQGDERLSTQSAGEEKNKLLKYLEELEAKESRLEEQKEIEELRRKIASKERRVKELESREKVKDKREKDNGGMTLHKLRQDSSLKRRVSKELSKLGLVVSSDSDLESDNDSELDSVLSAVSKQIKSSKVGKDDKKSGIDSKITDEVVNKQRYPHAALRFDFVNEGITFNKLDMNLFVAGELEIISECNNKIERGGRLRLLKRLMYLISSFEFGVVRSLYAAVLREIEMGSRTWSDDFQYVETAVLSRHKMRRMTVHSFGVEKSSKVVSEDSGEEVWFCSKFQRNKCMHKYAHTMVVKGKLRNAKHICATCWLKDKRESNHPECSSACPHTNE